MAQAELELITNIEQSLKALKEFQKQATKNIDGVQKQTKKISKSFTGFAKTANKSLESVTKGFGALKVAAAAAVGFIAGRALFNAIGDVTRAAAIQEDAINSLNTALKLSGDFTEQASVDMQQFASDLQSVTTIGDETTLEMLSLAKAFGTTNEQAQELVEAAAELSAATGISLDSAVKNLGKTLGGLTGELGETVPALRNLTAEQLKAGEGIAFVLERFGGAAASKIKTFSGATTQLANTFGDLQEQIGFSITQNPILIKGINILNEIFAKAIKVVKDNGETLEELVSIIAKGLLKTIPQVIRGIAFAIKVFNAMIQITVGLTDALASTIATFERFKGVKTVLKGLIAVFNSFKAGLASIGLAIVKIFESIPGGGRILKSLGTSAEEATKDLTKMLIASAKLVTSPGEGLNAVAESAADIAIKAREIGDAADEVLPDLAKSISEVADFADKAVDSIDGISAALSASGDFDIEANVKVGSVEVAPSAAGDVTDEKTDATKEATQGVISSFTESATTILSNISDTFSTIFSLDFFANMLEGLERFTAAPAAFDELFSKLGGVVEGIIESLPAAIDAMIKKIPEFISLFVKGFNSLVDTFIASAPEFIEKLVKGVTKIVSALVKALPKLIAVIPELIQKIADEIPTLIRTILKGLPAIITAIIEAIPKIVRTIADLIPEIVEVLADNIAPILEALIGGIIEAVPEIVNSLVDSFIVEGGAIRIVVAIVKGFINSIYGIVKGLVNGIAGAIPQLMKAFLTSFRQLFTWPKIDLPKFEAPAWLIQLRDILSGKTLIEKLQEFFDKLNVFGDIGGGGEGLIPDSTPILGGLATGGTIPSGFNNDDFLAGLTSGEMVVPRDDVVRLSDFLDQQQAQPQATGTDNATAQEVTVNLQIGEDQLANVILNLNRQGFRLS